MSELTSLSYYLPPAVDKVSTRALFSIVHTLYQLFLIDISYLTFLLFGILFFLARLAAYIHP